MAVFTIGSLSVRESALVGALIIDCIIQMAGWLISSALKTDKIYDMLGSTAFAVVAIGTLTYAHYYHARQIIVTVMVLLWAVRLGGFLVLRVMATGGDSRFNEVKDKLLKYFVYWFLQAVWVWVTTLPVQTLNATANNPGLWASDIVGGVIWIIGFLCESTADIQKFRFKQNPANKGKFITVGLWQWSRHPNYFGEMCMWWGIWLMSICILEKGYWLSVFSPLLTMGLLLFVSGIPIQEKQAKKRWGNDPAYQRYLRHSNLLVPLPLKFWANDPPESEQKLEARTSSDTQREGV